jgi:hypothetical protein
MVSNKEIIEQAVKIVDTAQIGVDLTGYEIYSKLEVNNLLTLIITKIKAINY